MEIYFVDILDRKKGFLDYKNAFLKKWKNLNFSKGISPRFWSKIRNFSIVCFSKKISMEIYFVDILDGKKGFIDCKNDFLKKWKKLNFSKGLGPRICSKIQNFSILCFSKK